MADNTKTRGAVKFFFWIIVSLLMIWIVVHSYTSGQMVSWYYYSSSIKGYAVNTNTFQNASKENPVILKIGTFAAIDGPVAVPVKAGDRLPKNTNGVIDEKVLQKGKRAALEGDEIKILVPWEIKESKGFKYRDTFKHKGVVTNPWSGAWNVIMVIALGITLGFMAEGFTDLLGWKIHKIRHFEGH